MELVAVSQTDKSLEPQSSRPSIEYMRADGDLDYSAIRYSRSQQISMIGELKSLGLIVRSGGDIYVFNPDLACWQHVANKSCQVFFNGAVGVSNATVNYTTAFEPYLPAIARAAEELNAIPQSICMGSMRLTVALSMGTLLLAPAEGVCRVSPALPSTVTTFCLRPVTVPLVPTRWSPSNICTVSQYLAPLFADAREYEGLLWLIGNSLLDPQPHARFVILYGPGGTGKSTVLSCIRTALRGACQAADISGYVTSRGTRLPRVVLEALFSSRVAVCGEVDFSTDFINSHFLKAITGNDSLPLPPFDATLSATSIVASNSLPRVDERTEWRSPSHARRVYVIPMFRDATALAPSYFRDRDEDCANWILRCVHCRLTNSRPPSSTRALLMALLASDWSLALQLVCVCPAATVAQAVAAAALMQRHLGVSVQSVSVALAFHCPSLYFTSCGIRFIRGLSPRVVQ